MSNETLLTAAQTDFDALAASVTAAMQRWSVPGVAVGIIHQAEQIAAGFGITSVEHPLPVTPRTVFQVGSISKTFTATAIMRLVEMNKLDLDRPVVDYLPAFRVQDAEASAQVTLRHLLNHTAGWPGDYFYDCGRGDDALARFVERMADLPQQTPVGRVFAYNNAAFGLAGRLVEVVTGQPFEQALHELVIAPLGLRTTFCFPEDVITLSTAIGHNKGDHGPVVARPWALTRSSHPVGGVLSNVYDLFRYAQFHMGTSAAANDESVLRESTRLAMRQPQTEGGCFVDQVGISWLINHFGAVRILGHAGSTNGQAALLRFIPEHSFAFVCLTNHDSGTNLCNEVFAWALEHFLGVQAPPLSLLPAPPAPLETYVGRYEAVLNDVVLKVRDEHLVLEVWDKGGFPTVEHRIVPQAASYETRLAFYAEGRAVALDDPVKDSRIEFLNGPDGRVEWLRFMGRLHRKL